MMAKPMKTREWHYTMIQFLIKADKPRGMLVEHEKNFNKPGATGEWFTNSSRVLPTSQVV